MCTLHSNVDKLYDDVVPLPLGLDVYAWSGSLSVPGKPTKEPIGFRVTGLTLDDHAFVHYAGGQSGKRKWDARWFQSGEKIFESGLFDSPQEALASMEKFRSEKF